MSWEAWGDDDPQDYDHLTDAGWLDCDEADILRGEMFDASWTRMVFLACVMIEGHPMNCTLALHDASTALVRLTVAQAARFSAQETHGEDE